MPDDKAAAVLTAESDAMMSDALRRILQQAPVAFAVTRGAEHTLIYANAEFRAVPGFVHLPKAGTWIGDLFDVQVATRLTGLLDRARREGRALRDQFLGVLTEGGRSWNCTVWPVLHDSVLPQGLVIELTTATFLERTLSLQREVAERLILNALQVSDAVEGAHAAERRAMFLADTGHQLSESLDRDTTRTVVAGLTLPRLAEWCIVDLLEEEDTVHRLTINHRDPHKQKLLSGLKSHWLPDAGDGFGVPVVRRNPQPVQIVDNIEEALGTAAHDPEQLRVLQELGIGSLLTVPIIAGRKLSGAITFVSGTRDVAFSDEDVELAEGLAARSALALENARLYGDALTLKDKAEAAAKTATKFLGTISHELRTPLNAIFGYVEVLALGIHGPVTDAQRVDLERITTNQRHLLVLIGELLNFMRLGSGRVLYDAVEVSLFVAATSALEVVEPLIAKKGLTCRISTDGSGTSASADADSVHQIVVNLLSNAAKFTESGGEIAIDCTEANGCSTITVTDNGRGIPVDKLEMIFEPFVQAQEADSKEHGGIGLGLAISRDLARAMHGELTVESIIGEGSRFTLTLPTHGSHEV